MLCSPSIRCRLPSAISRLGHCARLLSDLRSAWRQSPTSQPLQIIRRARDLEIVQYYGLVAPAGTPQPIIDRLNKELRKIVSSDDMKKRLLDAGGDPSVSTPEEYAQNIQREEGKWQAVIKKLGLVIKN